MTPGRSTKMGRRGIGVSMSGANVREEHKQFCGTIHSGQFMVSHFEAEGQEDEDDEDLAVQVVEDVKPAIVDTVISNIISKRNPELAMPSISSSNAITSLRSGSAGLELNRFGQKRQPLQLTSPHMSSQVEIDTDLSTVFNTLKIAYTHKLTSPKWNLFKGIRLRWKEKIRLNNVIWRCWHMQFVMKQNTLVCPFAAPFEVDVHKTPQSILLEGKYWKRKCNVITAEYKKWRRFYVSKALDANNIVDTTSELDFLEWSPRSSESLFLVSDSMPNDTLISTLSQYPFPNSREIAPGSSRAEFIQPSLAQLEDLMELDLDFLTTRLPSVPEEGSDEFLKDYRLVDYTESINSTAGPTSSLLVPSVPASNSSSGIISLGSSSSISQQQQQSPNILARIFTQNLTGASSAPSSASVTSGQQQQTQLGAIGSYPAAHLVQQPSLSVANVPVASGSTGNTSSSDEVIKDTKLRTSRILQKSFGREPHNYDRCEPTLHQRLAYNLVSQPHVGESTPSPSFQSSAYQVQPSRIIQVSGTPPNQNTLTYNIQPQTSGSTGNPMNLTNNTITGSSNPNLLISSTDSKLLTHSQSLPVHNQATNQISQPRSVSMPTAQNYPSMLPSQNVLQGGMLQHHHQDAFKGFLHPQTSSYKPYHSHQPPYKIPSQNALAYGNTGRSMRHSSPPHGHQSQNVTSNQQPSMGQSQQQLQDLQLQQQHQSSPQLHQKRLQPHPTKEMFRSNSLPVKFALPREGDSFAVPLYQAKPHSALRTRSNSMIMKQPGSSNSSSTIKVEGLPTSTSEPMLNRSISNSTNSNSTLEQLLTTKDVSVSFNVRQQSTTSSAINNLQRPQEQSHQLFVQQQPPSPYQQLPVGNPLSPTFASLQLNLSQPNLQQPSSQTTSPAQSSVLSFAASSPYAVVSLSPEQNTSANSLLDSDTNMSPLDNVSLDESSSSINAGTFSTGTNSLSLGGCSSPSGVGAARTGRQDNPRRSGHIHAEQKRRSHIKNGFEVLHSLIPQLQQNPNAKLSKAALLQKGADYIKQLRTERDASNERIHGLRRELNSLTASLSNLQTSLPASGAPVSRQRPGHLRDQYRRNIQEKSMHNWKYWMLGLIFEPLVTSYDQNVCDASVDDLSRSALMWVEHHCTLAEIRRAVSTQLRYLSTTTDVLSDPPASLQDEVLKAIAKWLATVSSSKESSSGCSNYGDNNDPNNPKPGPSGYKGV